VRLRVHTNHQFRLSLILWAVVFGASTSFAREGWLSNVIFLTPEKLVSLVLSTFRRLTVHAKKPLLLIES